MTAPRAPDRRDLLRLAGAGTAAALPGCRDRPASSVAAPPPSAAPTEDAAPRAPDDPATLHARLMTPPPGPPLQIAMVMYPQMTALDLVGPQLFLAGLTNAVVHLVAATAAPVATDTGLAIVPTTTFADAPARVDVLFVPGGSVGTAVAMRDPTLLGFVRARYATGEPRTDVVAAFWDARDGRYQPVTGPIYGIRLPAFAQLDLHAERALALPGGRAAVFVAVENVSGRANAEEVVWSGDYATRGYLTGLPLLALAGLRVTR